MKHLPRILCLILAAALVWPAAAAERERVALVIGNGAYTAVGKLENPANDARAVGETLERLGFRVILGIDLTKAGMEGAIRDFAEAAAGAETGLFYYAGHGIQVAGRNYLLPVDTELNSEVDLQFATIDTDVVYGILDRAAKTRIIMLDACRDNPFAASLSRSMGRSRSTEVLGRGLARTEAAGGALIAFATEPGNVAYDGDGEHSPFTRALLNHIETPGLEVNVMLTRVRAEVFAETGERQRPWTSSSLIGEVYLAEANAPAADDPAVSTDTVLELALWEAARTGETRVGYEAYLARFPEGAFAIIARSRLAAMTRDSPGRTGAAAAAGAAGMGEGDGDAAEPDGSSGTEMAAADPAADAPSSTPPPEEAEAALALDAPARTEIQERLSALGHDTRGIDGIFGPGTRSAIGAWQARTGLAATGYLDAAQLRRLEAESADRLAAFRAERARAAAEERARRERAPDADGTRTGGTTLYRAVSRCGRIVGRARDSDRQQAMLKAARSCAARGGKPACCTRNIRVDG